MRPFQRIGRLFSRVCDSFFHPDFTKATTAEDVFNIMLQKSQEHHPANAQLSGVENLPKASDLLLEAEIKAVWRKVLASKTESEQLSHWNDYVNLINSRSEEQIERMEKERGLS